MFPLYNCHTHTISSCHHIIELIICLLLHLIYNLLPKQILIIFVQDIFIHYYGIICCPHIALKFTTTIISLLSKILSASTQHEPHHVPNHIKNKAKQFFGSIYFFCNSNKFLWLLTHVIYIKANEVTNSFMIDKLK